MAHRVVWMDREQRSDDGRRKCADDGDGVGIVWTHSWTLHTLDLREFGQRCPRVRDLRRWPREQQRL